MKKILILTTVGPDKKEHGNYQDIYDRIGIFKDLGLEIQVAYFHRNGSNTESSEDIKVLPIDTTDRRLFKFDGALGLDSSVQVEEMIKVVKNYQPHFVFAEYFYFSKLITQLKPLFPDIQFCIRCHNFEYQHLREKFALKKSSSLRERLVRWYNLIRCHNYEKAMAASADLIFCISKYDADLYSRQFVGNNHFLYLPASMVYQPIYQVAEHSPLNVLYLGSDFSNSYNLEGAQWVVKIAKQVDSEKLKFHICGKNLPETIVSETSIKYHGFVHELEALLVNMDFAILPNYHGYGMKVKAYELFQRRFPVIITDRIHQSFKGTSGETYLVADSLPDWVDNCYKLQDPDLRARLSKNISTFMTQNFNQERVVNILKDSLNL